MAIDQDAKSIERHIRATKLPCFHFK